MAYTLRTKDNALDIGRAADQNESVDNDVYFKAQLDAGWTPSSPPPGVVRAFIRKTGLANGVPTGVFTVTTTNETGANDAGAWLLHYKGMTLHGEGPTGDVAVADHEFTAVRAMDGDGLGINSATILWTPVGGTYAVAASDAAAKQIFAVAVTIVETSEYVQTFTWDIDLTGTAITTGSVYGIATLFYVGFTTPPVIALV